MIFWDRRRLFFTGRKIKQVFKYVCTYPFYKIVYPILGHIKFTHYDTDSGKNSVLTYLRGYKPEDLPDDHNSDINDDDEEEYDDVLWNTVFYKTSDDWNTALRKSGNVDDCYISNFTLYFEVEFDGTYTRWSYSNYDPEMPKYNGEYIPIYNFLNEQIIPDRTYGWTHKLKFYKVYFKDTELIEKIFNISDRTPMSYYTNSKYLDYIYLNGVCYRTSPYITHNTNLGIEQDKRNKPIIYRESTQNGYRYYSYVITDENNIKIKAISMGCAGLWEGKFWCYFNGVEANYIEDLDRLIEDKYGEDGKDYRSTDRIEVKVKDNIKNISGYIEPYYAGYYFNRDNIANSNNNRESIITYDIKSIDLSIPDSYSNEWIQFKSEKDTDKPIVHNIFRKVPGIVKMDFFQSSKLNSINSLATFYGVPNSYSMALNVDATINEDMLTVSLKNCNEINFGENLPIGYTGKNSKILQFVGDTDCYNKKVGNKYRLIYGTPISSISNILSDKSIIALGTISLAYRNYAGGGLNLTIPSHIQVIGNYAFLGVKIKKLTIHKDVLQINHDAFLGCPIEELNIYGTNRTYYSYVPLDDDWFSYTFIQYDQLKPNGSYYWGSNKITISGRNVEKYKLLLYSPFGNPDSTSIKYATNVSKSIDSNHVYKYDVRQITDKTLKIVNIDIKPESPHGTMAYVGSGDRTPSPDKTYYIYDKNSESYVEYTGDTFVDTTKIVYFEQVEDGHYNPASVGSYRFANCENINTVKIGKYITQIESYAFYNNKQLSNLTIESLLDSYDYGIFWARTDYYRGLTIGTHAFDGVPFGYSENGESHYMPFKFFDRTYQVYSDAFSNNKYLVSVETNACLKYISHDDISSSTMLSRIRGIFDDSDDTSNILNYVRLTTSNISNIRFKRETLTGFENDGVGYYALYSIRHNVVGSAVVNTYNYPIYVEVVQWNDESNDYQYGYFSIFLYIERGLGYERKVLHPYGLNGNALIEGINRVDTILNEQAFRIIGMYTDDFLLKDGSTLYRLTNRGTKQSFSVNSERWYLSDNDFSCVFYNCPNIKILKLNSGLDYFNFSYLASTSLNLLIDEDCWLGETSFLAFSNSGEFSGLRELRINTSASSNVYAVASYQFNYFAPYPGYKNLKEVFLGGDNNKYTCFSAVGSNSFNSLRLECFNTGNSDFLIWLNNFCRYTSYTTYYINAQDEVYHPYKQYYITNSGNTFLSYTGGESGFDPETTIYYIKQSRVSGSTNSGLNMTLCNTQMDSMNICSDVLGYNDVGEIGSLDIVKNVTNAGHFAIKCTNFINFMFDCYSIPADFLTYFRKTTEYYTDISTKKTVNHENLKINVYNQLKYIGERAFESNSYGYQLDLHNVINNQNSLIRIGMEAFSNTKITGSITISANFVDSYAFSGCKGLTHITINNLIKLGSYAFLNCKDLQSVTLNFSINGYPGFRNDSYKPALKSLYAGIESCAFCGCTNLQTVTINGDAKYIETYAFGEYERDSSTTYDACTSLTTVSANSIEWIGKGAFYKCNSLNNLIVGNSLKNLGIHSLDGTQLFTTDVPDRCDYAYYYGGTWTTDLSSIPNLWIADRNNYSVSGLIEKIKTQVLEVDPNKKIAFGGKLVYDSLHERYNWTTDSNNNGSKMPWYKWKSSGDSITVDGITFKKGQHSVTINVLSTTNQLLREEKFNGFHGAIKAVDMSEFNCDGQPKSGEWVLPVVYTGGWLVSGPAEIAYEYGYCCDVVNGVEGSWRNDPISYDIWSYDPGEYDWFKIRINYINAIRYYIPINKYYGGFYRQVRTTGSSGICDYSRYYFDVHGGTINYHGGVATVANDSIGLEPYKYNIAECYSDNCSPIASLDYELSLEDSADNVRYLGNYISNDLVYYESARYKPIGYIGIKGNNSSFYDVSGSSTPETGRIYYRKASTGTNYSDFYEIPGSDTWTSFPDPNATYYIRGVTVVNGYVLSQLDSESVNLDDYVGYMANPLKVRETSLGVSTSDERFTVRSMYTRHLYTSQNYLYETLFPENLNRSENPSSSDILKIKPLPEIDAPNLIALGSGTIPSYEEYFYSMNARGDYTGYISHTDSTIYSKFNLANTISYIGSGNFILADKIPSSLYFIDGYANNNCHFRFQNDMIERQLPNGFRMSFANICSDLIIPDSTQILFNKYGLSSSEIPSTGYVIYSSGNYTFSYTYTDRQSTRDIIYLYKLGERVTYKRNNNPYCEPQYFSYDINSWANYNAGIQYSIKYKKDIEYRADSHNPRT